MRNLYVYAAEKAGDQHSELSLAERPDRDAEGRWLFAVFESPMMEEVYDSVLRFIRWERDHADGLPPDVFPYDARVICGRIRNAFLHFVNVPFTCRQSIDTSFADDGGGNVYRHGMKSMVLTYSPSSEPFTPTSA